MIKTLSIIILTIIMSPFNIATQFEFKSKQGIYGEWEYEKIIIEGKLVDASKQNECGYKDVLEINETSEIEEYEFNNIKIKGYQVGISNAKICTIDPVTYKHVISNNSCKTIWIRLINNPNRLVNINGGGVIEYEMVIKNKNSMTLSKVRDILNYSEQQPSKIQLKKVK